MQDNIKTTVKKSGNSRNTAKTQSTAVKKSSSVKKTPDKVVPAKRKASMHAVRAPRIINVKKKDKSPFPWSVLFVAILTTGLFLFMMMNYAEVDKYRNENTELQEQIASMQKTQGELEVELSNKYDQTEIRDYATNELGMVHVNELPNSNIHYITVEQEDKTEMHNYDDGEDSGFGYLLVGFSEIFRDFFNN